jgi:hypothetical protein
MIRAVRTAPAIIRIFRLSFAPAVGAKIASMRWAVLALTFVACSFDSSGSGINGTGGTGGIAGTGGTGGIAGTGGSGGIAGTGGSGGIAGTGGSGGMPDAAVDGPPPDAPIDGPPNPCTFAGQRLCINATQSGSCDGSLQPVPDRNCPPSSFCQNGTCRPPNEANGCDRENDCQWGQACDMYVSSDGTSIITVCTPNDGQGGAYSQCNTATGSQCQSSTCAEETVSGTVDQCFFACKQSQDCPMGGVCLDISSPGSLEGTSTAGIKSCFK